jgi:hypothetical protein
MAETKQKTRERRQRTRPRPVVARSEPDARHAGRRVVPFGHGSMRTQDNLLGDGQLLRAQRQALASRIGSTRGNTRLQSVVASLTPGGTKSGPGEAVRPRAAMHGEGQRSRVVQRGNRKRRVPKLTRKQKRTCERAKALTETLYQMYGFKTSMPYLVTNLAWRKRWYKFYWRIHYNMIWKMITQSKFMYPLTLKHLKQFKETIARHESQINWLIKNKGHRSAQGRNKEAKLVRYGYKFKYLRTYRGGAGRCTICDPGGKVLFYEITNDEVEQALDWLLRDAALKGYALAKERSAAAKIPFSYSQVLSEARREYRGLSRLYKRAKFSDFKKMLTLAKLIELNWETNYGLGGIGKYESKIVRALWMFHQRGNTGWKLIKLVWQSHMIDAWKLAAYRWALRFATGKWSH